MKRGQTIGCVAVFIAVLLVTQASVYADHFIAGGGRYSPTNRVTVHFQFLGVNSRQIVPAVPPIDTHIQCTIEIQYDNTLVRLELRLDTEPAFFTVKKLSETSHEITIKGKMLSKLFDDRYDEGNVSQREETVHFTLVAIDEGEPGEQGVQDSLTLTLDYPENITDNTASWLELGDLVYCNSGTRICTLILKSYKIDGEIEGHAVDH